MCPHTNGDSTPVDRSEMVQVPLTNGASNGTNGVNKVEKRGTSRPVNGTSLNQRLNPYAPRASDFLSNISNFNIIESTLRGNVAPDRMLLLSLADISYPHLFQFIRGRAIRKCFLRHQDQDRHRQSSRCFRCRIYRTHITSCLRTVAGRL